MNSGYTVADDFDISKVKVRLCDGLNNYLAETPQTLLTGVSKDGTAGTVSVKVIPEKYKATYTNIATSGFFQIVYDED